jgi:Fe-S-cluster containining protein
MNSCRVRDDERNAALAEVQAVYFELAARPIDRRCTLRTECCYFKLTGLTPFLTKGEALLAARALRASGRRKIPDRKDGACPLLDPETSRCLVYQARPFGCRTHFCGAAGGPYSRREVLDLIRRLERVDAEIGGNGSRPLPNAVAEGLKMLA